MHRVIFFFLSFFFSINCSAQIEFICSIISTDSIEGFIGTSGEYVYNSNALLNPFIHGLYNGQFIDNQLKDEVSGKLKKQNRLGVNAGYNIYYAFRNKEKSTGFFVSLKNKEHLDTQFSQDLFNLAFYGNKRFDGKVANLDNFSFNLLKYQELQFGFVTQMGKQYKENGRLKLGLGLSLLKGEQSLVVNSKRARLFTSYNMQNIEFQYDAIVNRSDTLSKGLNTINGLGAGLELFLEIPYILQHNPGKIRIEMKDLGAIFWNTNSLTYHQDTVYHFDGLQAGNILKPKDSFFNPTYKDSAIASLFSYQKKSYKTNIPAIFDISTTTSYGDFQFVKGFRYMFNANYLPCYYLKANYSFSKKTAATFSVGYGGYGNLNFGLELNKEIGTGFILHAGSNNIEGFIVPKLTTGQGIYASLRKIF